MTTNSEETVRTVHGEPSRPTPRLPRLIVMDVSRGRSGTHADQPRLMWRLLAANNRAIGQSARVYSTASAVADAAADAKAAIDAMTVQIERISPAPAWRWTAATGAGAELIAIGSHHYRRRIECARGFGQFRECLMVAELDGADWIIHPATVSPVADAVVGNR